MSAEKYFGFGYGRLATVVLLGAFSSLCAADLSGTNQPPALWKDASQSVDVRIHDLVSRMTLEEKASQIQANPPAIPRLGIPAYSHRNECLHGVGDAGIATVFPQAIGMAATWNVLLVQGEADVVATEGRAK